MDWQTYLQSLAGGALIGLSAAFLLVVNGRIAGVSGIVGGLLGRIDTGSLQRVAFVAGLVLGPIVFRMAFGDWPEVRIQGSIATLAVAGFLVGFGTRLGSGCTSGHGVCGVARLSKRSVAAVATFFLVAIVTVFVMNHGIAP
jgi:uncharacterized protein